MADGATPSRKQQEIAGIVGEILAILLGLALIAFGWTGLGQMLAAIGGIGLVISLVRYRRLMREST